MSFFSVYVSPYRRRYLLVNPCGIPGGLPLVEGHVLLIIGLRKLLDLPHALHPMRASKQILLFHIYFETSGCNRCCVENSAFFIQDEFHTHGGLRRQARVKKRVKKRGDFVSSWICEVRSRIADAYRLGRSLGPPCRGGCTRSLYSATQLVRLA